MMLEQLGGWQLVALILGGGALLIPWLFGLFGAVSRAYSAYFDRVVALFGVEPHPQPPVKPEHRPAPDGGYDAPAGDREREADR